MNDANKKQENIYNTFIRLDRISEYFSSNVGTILDYKAREQDFRLQDDLLKQLIRKYVALSNELEEKVDEVTRLSITDPLTGIFNRLKFHEELNYQIESYNRYKHPLSLIMFDIDKFKKINDSFGHDVGDDVLVKLVGIVKNCIRNTDIFARWGGEEFMILTPNINMGESVVLAERSREAIASYDFSKVGKVTCSFGVTQFSTESDDNAFIKLADDALYEAKESGRNCVKSRN